MQSVRLQQKSKHSRVNWKQVTVKEQKQETWSYPALYRNLLCLCNNVVVPWILPYVIACMKAKYVQMYIYKRNYVYRISPLFKYNNKWVQEVLNYFSNLQKVYIFMNKNRRLKTLINMYFLSVISHLLKVSWRNNWLPTQ